jgi:hypothetical protein
VILPLPKIQHPLFDVEVPSTKQHIKIRPMLVREEKILLIAKESEDDIDIFTAIKQVVNNCIVDDINVDELALFDLEYIYLKIRAVSVDNMIKLAFRDSVDNQVYEFDVDLNEVKVKFPEKVEKKILINETMGVLLRYPSAALYGNKEVAKIEDVSERMNKMIIDCIDKIFDDEMVYKAKDHTEKELMEFLDELPIEKFNMINEFIANMPVMRHELKYTNKEGTEVVIVLSTLNDFFTLR